MRRLGLSWCRHRSGRLVRYFIMSPVMVSTPSAPGPASEPLRFRRLGRHALRQLGPVCWVADFESAMVHGVEGAPILIL